MKLGTIILAGCIALGFVFLCGLGFWQLQRLAWKESLIERVQQNMTNAPLSAQQVESMINQGEDIEYRPATVSGRFLHDGEAHFFATHKSQPGYFIYTPLQQANGKLMMVNRGFVSMEMKDIATRQIGQISDPVTIVGLARSAPVEKPNSFVPNNDLAKNIFYWKSLPQMLSMSGKNMKAATNRFFIDADDTPVRGGPEGGVTLIQFPNSHLQYALTWFGLAGSLLVVGGFFLWSRRSTKHVTADFGTGV